MRMIPNGPKAAPYAPVTRSDQAAGENVIAIDRFRNRRSLSPLRQAEAYWTALCDETGVPRRSQVDPRGLSNILQNTFILERVAPRVARFRLAGALLEDLAGMDVRGIPFTALFSDAARVEAGSLLERVFSAPHVAELRLTQAGSPGRSAGEGRMLLLPLATDDGEIARALGVLVADGGCGRLPCRFDISDRILRPVAAGPQDPAPTPPAPTVAPEPQGFAEPHADFGTASHLRLVK